MKVAISLPDPVFNAAESLAEQLRVSRSQLYAQAIAQYVQQLSAPAVTAKLNAVYAAQGACLDPVLMPAQLQVLGDEAW